MVSYAIIIRERIKTENLTFDALIIYKIKIRKKNINIRIIRELLAAKLY